MSLVDIYRPCARLPQNLWAMYGGINKILCSFSSFCLRIRLMTEYWLH